MDRSLYHLLAREVDVLQGYPANGIDGEEQNATHREGDADVKTGSHTAGRCHYWRHSLSQRSDPWAGRGVSDACCYAIGPEKLEPVMAG